MDANLYMRKAARTANSNVAVNLKGDDAQLVNALMGLNGEAGECIDILKKHLFQGHTLDKEALIDELGDVAWYLAIACNSIGYSLNDVMHHNVEKLSKRYPNGFEAKRSVRRGD